MTNGFFTPRLTTSKLPKTAQNKDSVQFDSRLSISMLSKSCQSKDSVTPVQFKSRYNQYDYPELLEHKNLKKPPMVFIKQKKLARQ